MAACASPVEETITNEPRRDVCAECFEPVLIAVVADLIVVADVHEWEPRARCYVCSGIAARGQRRMNCDRCGGSRYVGSKRPPGRMLAIDVAWSDDGHVRTIAARTPRRKGEALYPLHVCAGEPRLALVA